MAIDIFKYRDKIIQEIYKFAETAGVESIEINEAIKEAKEDDANFREFAKDKDTWRDFIYGNEDVNSIDNFKEICFKVINNLSKKKREKELNKSKEDVKWWKEESDYWHERKEWWRKYNAGELDWQKDQSKRTEENKKKLEESEKNRENDERKENEQWKKRFIGDIEMDLIEKNVTGEKLSERLKVSDWREKINGAADFYEALSRRSNLWSIIRKLQDEQEKKFTCASCGKEKEKYYNWPTAEGKKYCSAECWNKGEGKITHTEIISVFLVSANSLRGWKN